MALYKTTLFYTCNPLFSLLTHITSCYLLLKNRDSISRGHRNCVKPIYPTETQIKVRLDPFNI